jgi:3-oxoacyl-[acyl-carrier protein] reductase
MGDILRGKVAVVTGSGQGIGRAIAMGFAEEGAKVVTNNRKRGSTGASMVTQEQINKLSAPELEQFQKGMAAENGDAETTAAAIKAAGGEATAVFGDISKIEDAERLIEATIEAYGRIDILCNVAGGFGFSVIEDITDELWDRVNGTKPRGYFHTMKFAIPHMKRQKSGRILNCASPAFLGDVLKHAEYCAANAGVVGLTRGAAIELRPHGITVNCFAPYALTRASYELEAAKATYEKSILTEGKSFIELGATPGPEYVAPFVIYLASDKSEKVSGATFIVGGNMVGLYSMPAPEKMLFKQAPEKWDIGELFERAETELFADYKSIAD